MREQIPACPSVITRRGRRPVSMQRAHDGGQLDVTGREGAERRFAGHGSSVSRTREGPLIARHGRRTVAGADGYFAAASTRSHDQTVARTKAPGPADAEPV